jgi:hypothetical protein
LSLAAVEKFFAAHRVAITSVTVVEWITKHANDLTAIQKLVNITDLVEGPQPIHGLQVDVAMLKKIRAARTLSEVDPEIKTIIETRVQAEAELLRFTLVSLVLAFEVGVAEARLTDPIQQQKVVAAMATCLEANLDYVKDELVATLRSFYAGITKRAEIRRAFCTLVGSLAYTSLVNFHCSINGVKLAPDMDLSMLKGDQFLQRIAKADDPVDILKAIGPKDIQSATPKYLSSLQAILTAFGVSPETIGYWCSRLSKALADKKIPDKNDMLDMLVLEAVSHTNGAVLATADDDVCEMLKQYHPPSYAFLQKHLPDALPR